MTALRLLDAKGRVVALAGEVARGGEGAVYDLVGQPGNVAKIYLTAPDPAKAEKITAMVGMATDRLRALSAWPSATVHAPGGGVAGFVMPKLTGHRPVFQVYGPKLRLKQFPRADWRFLVHTAGNVARAFHVMHESGLVIGDVNHGNLFVAEDATVRFIDADSMQVTRGRRVWPCEVGVSTHQPPEMQGVASYRDLVRTANHDAFGLAVLVFQLLCMGRHPFSGRYAGPGEPPDIERAITESRYAYSRETSRTQMAPPPGSLPIAALPPALTGLFEAAFAPAAAKRGRPSAEQWTAELGRLEGSLRKCGVNAAHWYSPVAPSCPWCDVEGRSGVVLFPVVFLPGRAGAGGIAVLWQEIQSLPDPGPLAGLQPPDARSARPSPRIQAVAGRLRRRRALAAAILLVGVAIAAAAGRMAVLPAVVALAAAVWWAWLPPEIAQARQRLAEMRRLWIALEAKWVPGPGQRFAATRQALGALKQEYDQIPERRATEATKLATNRRQEQLQAYLEGFEIARAKITGIGKAKVATLLSYGVETAFDIQEARIVAVPGFGPKTIASLVAFRAECEAAFRFDAGRSVSSSAVAALDGMLAQRRAKIEAEMAAGLAQLRTMLVAETRHRGALEGQVAELRPHYAQALADARALGVRASA